MKRLRRTVASRTGLFVAVLAALVCAPGTLASIDRVGGATDVHAATSVALADPLAGVDSNPPASLGTQAVRVSGGRAAPRPAPKTVALSPRLRPEFSSTRAGATIRSGSASVRFHLLDHPYEAPRRSAGERVYAAPGSPTVRFDVSSARLKEDIVLANRTSASRPLRFEVVTKGASLVRDDAGWLVSRDGAALWRVESPFAVDAAGRRGDVDVHTAGSRWTYTLDADFVRTAKYPVTVDPTISTVTTAAPSRPAARRNFKLSDGTAVVASYASGGITFATAASPYTSWSGPVTAVAAAADDFAATTDGSNTLWFAYRDAAKALLVTKYQRSGSVWSQAAGFPVSVESSETYAPYIGRSSGGTLVVSFQRYTSGVVNEIRLASSTNGGTTWGTETVSTITNPATQIASVAEFVGSDLGVVHADGASNLVWRKRVASGGSWSSTTALGTFAAGQLSVAGDGTALTLAKKTPSGTLAMRRYSTASGWETVDTTFGDVIADGPQVTTNGSKTWVFFTESVGARQSSLRYRMFDGSMWGGYNVWEGLPSGRVFDRVWDHNAGLVGSGWFDRTTGAANTTTNDVTFASNNNDELYLGLDVPFSQVRYTAGTGTALNITPRFDYWDGSAWVALGGVDSLVDRSTGGTTTGTISWNNPTNADGTPKWQRRLVQSSDLYYLRVTRTNAAALELKATQITAMPYVLAPIAAEYDTGLLPLSWAQANVADTAYDVKFDAIDLTAPTVTLTSPTTSSTCGAVSAAVCDQITLTATATDNYAGVKQVDFWVADTHSNVFRKLGTDTTAPYALDFRTQAIADGATKFAVTAVDNQNNTANSNFATATTVSILNKDLIGAQGYTSNWVRQIGDRVTISVNRYTGNLSVAFDGGAAVAPGPQQTNTWTYNSRSRSDSPFGYAWSFGTVSSLTENADQSVDARTGDGATYHFTKTAGTYTRPPGVFLNLVKNGDGTFDLADKKGVTSHYNTSGQLTSINDRDTRTATYVTSPSATTISYPGPRSTTINQTAGRVTSLVLSGTEDGVTSSTTTTPGFTNSNLTSLTDAAGGLWQFRYDDLGRMDHIIDARGYSWDIIYAGTGLYDWVVRVEQGFQFAQSFDYGTLATPLLHSTFNAVGDTEQLTFNSAGAETKHVDGEGGQQTFTRDADHNITETRQNMCIPVPVPPATCATPDIVTSATWDANGNQLTFTDGRNSTTTTTYNALNQPLSITDALSRKTTNTYDTNGHLLTTVTPRGNEAGATPAEYTTTYTYGVTAPYNMATKIDPPHDSLTAPQRTTSYDATLDYDVAGRNIKETAPATGSPAQTHITYVSYDGLGRQTTTRDARSASSVDNAYATIRTYDALGRLLTEALPVTSGQTHVTRTTYDANGNLLSTSDARSSGPSDHTYETTYTYDSAGQRITETKPPTGSQTHITTTQYDGAGRVYVVTDPTNAATTTTYDHAGRIQTLKNALNRTTTYYYDAAGRKVRVQAPTTGTQTHTTYYFYDAGGNKIVEADPRSTSPTDNTYAVTFAYDAANQLIRQEVPLAGTTPRTGSGCTAAKSCTTYLYDADGHRTGTTDPRGNVLGASPASYTSTLSYDALGNLATSQIPSQSPTANAYDALSRVVSTTDPNNHTTTYEYDAVGNRTAASDPLNNRTSYTYDAADRVVAVVAPRGNASGALASDYTTTFQYDAVNNLTVQTAPQTYSGPGGTLLTHVTRYNYDALSRLTYSNDPRSISPTDTAYRTTNTYDAMGRLLSATTPDNTISFQYDKLGNRTKRTTQDPNTNAVNPATVTNYTFDELSRPKVTTYVGTAPVGGSDQTVTTSYDAANNVTSTVDSVNGTVNATFNSAGWRTTDAGTSSSTTYGRDAVGNVISTTNTVAGIATSFQTAWRGDNRQAARCTTAPCPATPPAAGTTTIGYDASGRPMSLGAGNGSIDEYSRDAANRLINRKVRPTPTASPTVDWTTTYDEDSNQTSVSATPSGPTLGGDDYTYRYDRMGLLTVMSFPNPDPASISPTLWARYSYDAAGNVLRRELFTGDPDASFRTEDAGSSVVQTENFTYGGRQMKSSTIVAGTISLDTSYSYDNRGNLLSKTGTNTDAASSYTWDRENRLAQVTKTSSPTTPTSYKYDAVGRRVRKQAGNTASPTVYSYRWDGPRLAAILSGESTSTTVAASFSYSAEGQPLAMTVPSVDTFYYHFDQVGNVERLTASGGGLLARYTYDNRGKALATKTGAAWNAAADSLNPFRTLAFDGGLFQGDGLLITRGSTYDTTIGQLISAPGGPDVAAAPAAGTAAMPEPRQPDRAAASTASVPGSRAVVRTKVSNYALQWSNNSQHNGLRNPYYREFGNDCTNFVSQAVYAGGWYMDNPYYYGQWYYSDSYVPPAWSVTDNFVNYAVASGRATRLSLASAALGDILIFDNTPYGDVDHLGVITGIGKDGILYSAHTSERHNYPLNKVKADHPSMKVTTLHLSPTNTPDPIYSCRQLALITCSVVR